MVGRWMRNKVALILIVWVANAHGFCPAVPQYIGEPAHVPGCSVVRGFAKSFPPVRLRATAGTNVATDSVYTYVSKPAGRIGFLVNTWKTQAENQRSRGWTSSTEEEMIELQRVAATAEQLKGGMQTIMQRAAAEQAAEANGGEMPDSIPDNIKQLRLLAAISGGHGSAVGLYRKTDDALEIDLLIANTQLDGQFKAQQGVVDKLVADAKEEGLKEVRLSDNTHETLFGEYTDLGFKAGGDDEAWSVHKDL